MAVNNIETLQQGINTNTTATINNSEVEGIEILVNMAKQGKIDPWNVDIVDVYDKYMMQVFQAKGQNLRLTGRTILFAEQITSLSPEIIASTPIEAKELTSEKRFPTP